MRKKFPQKAAEMAAVGTPPEATATVQDDLHAFQQETDGKCSKGAAIATANATKNKATKERLYDPEYFPTYPLYPGLLVVAAAATAAAAPAV